MRDVARLAEEHGLREEEEEARATWEAALHGFPPRDVARRALACADRVASLVAAGAATRE